MKTQSPTDALIKELLDATYGQGADVRQKFVFRQALLGLVRLAKAEQVFEMRTSVEKLIGNHSFTARQRAKTRAGNRPTTSPWPQQLEFSQFD